MILIPMVYVFLAIYIVKLGVYIKNTNFVLRNARNFGLI